jgi:DNA-3-methyladenine glycosylase
MARIGRAKSCTPLDVGVGLAAKCQVRQTLVSRMATPLDTRRASAELERLLQRDTPDVAASLIGWHLVHAAPGSERLVGRIVETEAYLAEGDLASHSAPGPTARNGAMFLAPGHVYVYLIYGMHHCLNVVTARAGIGEAVLVRALEPLAGQGTMRARRGADVPDRDLCRGPGRLCRAFGLTRAHDGLDLRSGPLRLVPPQRRDNRPERLVGPRVGITKSADLMLRFREADSRWTT